jgi:hypothetical protein
MAKREIQICPACNRATETMFIHGHGQCSFCKTNIDPFVVGKLLNMKTKKTLQKLNGFMQLLFRL